MTPTRESECLLLGIRCPLCRLRIAHYTPTADLYCWKCGWAAGVLGYADGSLLELIERYRLRLATGWRLPGGEWFQLEWLVDAATGRACGNEYHVIDGAVRETGLKR